MKHGVAGRKLGRNESQRKALWRGLITDLFRHDRISTTEAKARSVRGDAEHLISVAKRSMAAGGNPVHARRQAARVITDPEITKRLFDDVAPRFSERAGGVRSPDHPLDGLRGHRRFHRPVLRQAVVAEDDVLQVEEEVARESRDLGRLLAQEEHPDPDVPHQLPLIRVREGPRVGELADLADVVEDGRCDEDVDVQGRVIADQQPCRADQ